MMERTKSHSCSDKNERGQLLTTTTMTRMNMMAVQSILVLLVTTLLVDGTAAASPASPVVQDFMRAMDKAIAEEGAVRRLKQNLWKHAVPAQRHLEDGNNGGANANDDGEIGNLDLKDYALKYTGCQNIKSFSDDLAADEDSRTVLAMNRFVTFRFCQADLCSNYHRYGCEYDFGEYVVEMEYYLEAMATYHFDRYEEYCSACIECMTPSSDNGDDDGAAAAYANYTDDAVAMDDGYNVTQDVNATSDGNATSSGWSAKENCKYYSACENYREACKQYINRAIQYEEFFTCTEFEVGNNVAYVGPFCAKDGKTIKIGIFDDMDCENYIGDVVDLQTFTGIEFDDWGLSFYDNGHCISCVNEVSGHPVGLCRCDDRTIETRIHCTFVSAQCHVRKARDFWFRFRLIGATFASLSFYQWRREQFFRMNGIYTQTMVLDRAYTSSAKFCTTRLESATGITTLVTSMALTRGTSKPTTKIKFATFTKDSSRTPTTRKARSF